MCSEVKPEVDNKGEILVCFIETYKNYILSYVLCYKTAFYPPEHESNDSCLP